MSEIHFSDWIERGRRVLRVLGTFDASAARRLLDEIRAARGNLVIDVGLVHGLDEVGLAALARLAGGGDGRIAVRGLSSRQRRILRNLGAELAAL